MICVECSTEREGGREGGRECGRDGGREGGKKGRREGEYRLTSWRRNARHVFTSASGFQSTLLHVYMCTHEHGIHSNHTRACTNTLYTYIHVVEKCNISHE